MLPEILLLAFSLSIDATGIGITYGIRKIKVSLLAKTMICLIAFLLTFLAVSFGKALLTVIEVKYAKYIGATMLALLGIFIIKQAFSKQQKNKNKKTKKNNKIHEFIFRSVKISIEIIKNPSNGDMDNSHSIDLFEAIYLGFAMSIDSLGVGISYATTGSNCLILPFSVSIFQFIFISLGLLIGKRASNIKAFKQNLFSIVCGAILIAIAITRIF